MNVSIVGAGSWGTAVAWLLGNKGVEVCLRPRSDEVAAHINEEHANPRYLKDVRLPRTVRATADLEEAVSGAHVVVTATPSHAVRETAEALKGLVEPDTKIVSLSKGLEQGTLMRMTEVLSEVLGGRERTSALSGPNHAEEVSRGAPTASVLACYEEETGVALQELFTSPTFRVYTNRDVVGVEMAAASKNVVAVACGISDGLGYGDNSKAALMTRGLAEMTRLGRAVGAEPLTFMGLAGIGDLIATCTSRHSRNRALGELLGRGGSLQQFEQETRMVAEGAWSAESLSELGERLSCELPITSGVRAILYEGTAPETAVKDLLSRTAADESRGLLASEEGARA